MPDTETVSFLQWALPRLRMRWPGFRRVRGQVAKRLRRRVADLGLPDLDAYRHRLEADEGEWAELDARCRVTISRFLRDRAVWTRIAVILEQRGKARAWCAGCASGEEPYSLAIVARESGARVEIVATDADAHLLARARAARYGRSSLRELSPRQVEAYFDADGTGFVLRPDLRSAVGAWRSEDLRAEMPDGPFDLVFCRNLAFTYFEEALQREILARIRRRLAPGGLLVIGAHEVLPSGRGRSVAPCLFCLAGDTMVSVDVGDSAMGHETHQHDHQHGKDCGHVAVKHEGHVDYLHDGHMHHPHDDHCDEHRIEVDQAHPAVCTPDHACEGHDPAHVHGPGCGHDAVPHGDHVDYLVSGHLHHPHDGHCDDHGPLEIVSDAK